MSTIVIDVALVAYKFEEMYKGRVRNLLVSSRDGRRIQLPLTIFRPFLTHQGVFGAFMVKFDENNKLLDIQKIN